MGSKNPQLQELMTYADINYLDDNGPDGFEIEFYIRETRDMHLAWGNDLDDVLDAAIEIMHFELTLSDLHREGLTDEDIARLSAPTPTIVSLDDAWTNGYDAGALDAGRAFQSAFSAPAIGAMAEPFDDARARRDADILSKHPTFIVEYVPARMYQLSGDDKE